MFMFGLESTVATCIMFFQTIKQFLDNYYIRYFASILFMFGLESTVAMLFSNLQCFFQTIKQFLDKYYMTYFSSIQVWIGKHSCHLHGFCLRWFLSCLSKLLTQ